MRLHIFRFFSMNLGRTLHCILKSKSFHFLRTFTSSQTRIISHEKTETCRMENTNKYWIDIILRTWNSIDSFRVFFFFFNIKHHLHDSLHYFQLFRLQTVMNLFISIEIKTLVWRLMGSVCKHKRPRMMIMMMTTTHTKYDDRNERLIAKKISTFLIKVNLEKSL